MKFLERLLMMVIFMVSLSIDEARSLLTSFLRMTTYYFVGLLWPSVTKIKEVLAAYEVASGQMVNKDKTTLFFSRNTDDAAQEAIKVSLGLLAIQHYEKYLGLPSFIGREKKACFTQIKERIW